MAARLVAVKEGSLVSPWGWTISPQGAKITVALIKDMARERGFREVKELLRV
ncbi:MAG: hypothetical protein GXX09_07275 [Syntrophomonadaceae bacterium]|nr:hypothetical protein [Syntrophomonadaceae bacterium]